MVDVQSPSGSRPILPGLSLDLALSQLFGTAVVSAFLADMVLIPPPLVAHKVNPGYWTVATGNIVKGVEKLDCAQSPNRLRSQGSC